MRYDTVRLDEEPTIRSEDRDTVRWAEVIASLDAMLHAIPPTAPDPALELELEVTFEDNEDPRTAPVTVRGPPPDLYDADLDETDPFIDASDPMLFAFESAAPYPISRSTFPPTPASIPVSSDAPTPRVKRAS